MKTRIVIVFCALFAVLACGDSGSQIPLENSELEKFQECTNASECIYAQNGCCDCANGGAAIAIHEDQQDAFAGAFDCEGAACTLLAAVPACNEGTASCENGLCQWSRSPATE